MRIIFQGDDTRKAKTWLQFAKNKLRQLKAVMPGVINNVYSPVSGVLVHIKSVSGTDTIRIVTEGGKYMCDFPDVDRYPIPHSDFQVRCPVRPKGADEFLDIGFLSKTNDIGIGGDWDTYTWDFGDGNFDTGASVFHQYDEPGEYTVSLTVAKSIISTNLFGISMGGERLQGVDNTIIEPYLKAQSSLAWADYLAAVPGFFSNNFEWAITSSNKGTFVGLDWREDVSFGFLSQDTSRQFNLTGIDPNAVVTAYINLFPSAEICNTPAHADPCYADTNGLINVSSSAGASFTPFVGMSNPVNMGDISGSIGGIVQVDVTGAYAETTIPHPGTWPQPNGDTHFNSIGVWGSQIWAVAEEPTSSLKTTKVIKVYTGRRGHKRSFQVGDSVHT